MFFFAIELIMIYDDKWHYFMDLTKVMDFCSYILYWIYLGLTVEAYKVVPSVVKANETARTSAEKALPDASSAESSDIAKFILVIMNVLVLLCAFVKLQLYLRVYEEFGLLNKLLYEAILEVKIFAFFFYGWIFMFSLLFQILGMQVADNDDDESDYPNVNIFMVYFLQTYRNSIGDIAAPDYSFWTTRGASGELYSSKIMVFFVWLLWFAN